MALMDQIPVVYENGVLRPEQPLAIPDKTRLVVAIHSVSVTPESAAAGLETLRRIQREGLICLNGWHPTRDEMHERD